MLHSSHPLLGKPLDAVMRLMLFPEGFEHIKKKVQGVIESIPLEIQGTDDDPETLIKNYLDGIESENADKRTPLEKYRQNSWLRDPCDPHRYGTRGDDYGMQDVSRYSPYFSLIYDLIDSHIYLTRERLQAILRAPEKHTLGDIITASEREIALFRGKSDRETRQTRVKYERVMQALMKENAHISYLNQEYSSYKKISPSLAFIQEDATKEKEPDTYIESTFAFGRSYAMSFKFYQLRNTTDKIGCLVRSMGSSSNIGHHYLFGTPPNEQNLKSRQDEIESILSSGQVSEILPLRDHGRGLAEISAGLESYLGESSHEDHEGFLWAYLYNNSYNDTRYSYYHPDFVRSEDVSPIVSAFLRVLPGALMQYRSFIEACSHIPVWRERATHLLEYFDAISPYLTTSALLGGYSVAGIDDARKKGDELLTKKQKKSITSSYGSLYSAIDALRYEAEYFGEVITLVSMIEQEKWSRITHDGDRSFGYTDGRHPNKSYEDQFPNPSHADNPITLYSGANTSGKSWGLQRDFIIRRAACTLGYAPVSGGNFPKRYEMTVFLDRASTNSRAGRSAYMEEIHRIMEMLKACTGKLPLVYIDEPFSTTAPEDQSVMIEILVERTTALGQLIDIVLSLGGDIVIATHNKKAMELLGAKYGDKVGFYHYEYEVLRSESGELQIVTQRKLAPGIADAQSIEVAEMNGAPRDFIESARAFMTDSLDLSPQSKRTFTADSKSTEKERKTILEGLTSLFPTQVGEDARFHLYSTDSDFAQNGIRDIRKPGKSLEEFQAKKGIKKGSTPVHLSDLVDQNYTQYLISHMILRSASIDHETLMGRQRLLGTLSKDHTYRKILHLMVRCTDLESTWEKIWDASREGINITLNPVRGPRPFQRPTRLGTDDLKEYKRKGESVEYEKNLYRKWNSDNWENDQDEVSEAILFLKINKKLLSKDCPPEVMSLIRELSTYEKFCKYYSSTEHGSVERTLGRDKEKTEVSYLRAFIDEAESERDDDDTLLQILRSLREEQVPSRDPDEVAFIEGASQMFHEYVPKGFQTVDEISKYLGDIRMRLIELNKVLPKISYGKLDIQKIYPDLLSLYRISSILFTGYEDSKVRKVRSQYQDFDFSHISSNLTRGIAPALLKAEILKREYPRLRKALAKIDDPYIASSLRYLDARVAEIYSGNIQKEPEASVSPSNSRNHISHLHTVEKKKNVLGGTNKNTSRYAFTSELDRLGALCTYASYIADEHIHPVDMNTTGELHFPNNQNTFDTMRYHREGSEKLVENDFSLKADSPLNIVTGPNGSGKTYFGKSGIVSVLQSLSTGYSMSKGATLPLFNRVIYFDRVNEQDSIHSSFANELEYWKKIWKILDSGESVLIFCDEMFSTVPPKYQAAFSASVLDKILRTGSYLVTASHHHSWVDWVMKNRPETFVSHLDFEITDGLPVFRRKLRPGHRSSHAREVAKKMGFE